MKKILLFVLSFALFMYLLGSFIDADFCVSHWSSESRLIEGVIYFVISVVYILFSDSPD